MKQMSSENDVISIRSCVPWSKVDAVQTSTAEAADGKAAEAPQGQPGKGVSCHLRDEGQIHPRICENKHQTEQTWPNM